MLGPTLKLEMELGLQITKGSWLRAVLCESMSAALFRSAKFVLVARSSTSFTGHHLSEFACLSDLKVCNCRLLQVAITRGTDPCGAMLG